MNCKLVMNIQLYMYLPTSVSHFNNDKEKCIFIVLIIVMNILMFQASFIIGMTEKINSFTCNYCCFNQLHQFSKIQGKSLELKTQQVIHHGSEIVW